MRCYKSPTIFDKNSVVDLLSNKLQLNRILAQDFINMQGTKASISCLFCFIILAFAVFFSISEAAYRRPPFNGSIFGKRTGVNNDLENTGKALSAMCEIASEACQTWFPTQEK